MLTSTHILIGGALSARPRFKPYQIALAWLGGFFPDLSIFVMVAFSRVFYEPGIDLWRKPFGLYWQEPWQFYSAVSNSFPLWIGLCLAGWILLRRGTRLKTAGLNMLIFCSAALAHISVDFVTHARDAHIQFWPFSNWRFHSPISYYDPAFYGNIVAVFETIMGIGIIIYLVWSFKNWPIRLLAVLFGLPYLVRLWFVFNGVPH